MLACRIRLEGCDPGVLNIVVIAEARVHNQRGETTTNKEGAASNSEICVQVREWLQPRVYFGVCMERVLSCGLFDCCRLNDRLVTFSQFVCLAQELCFLLQIYGEYCCC